MSAPKQRKNPERGRVKAWFGQFWHTLKTMHQAFTCTTEDGKVYRGCADCEWGEPGLKEMADILKAQAREIVSVPREKRVTKKEKR